MNSAAENPDTLMEGEPVAELVKEVLHDKPKSGDAGLNGQAKEAESVETEGSKTEKTDLDSEPGCATSPVIKTKAAMKEPPTLESENAGMGDEEMVVDENNCEDKVEESGDKKESCEVSSPPEGDAFDDLLQEAEKEKTVTNGEEKVFEDFAEEEGEMCADDVDDVSQDKNHTPDPEVDESHEKPEEETDVFDATVSVGGDKETEDKKVEFDSTPLAVDAKEKEEIAKKDEQSEVFTVEDTGELLQDEEGTWMKNVPSDEDYFAKLDAEELEYYKEHGPKVETVGDNGLKCSTCFRQVTNAVGSHFGIVRHPKLGVGVCKPCKMFYKDGEDWEKDEEGLDTFCRWCAEGGEIIICDKCPSAFCRKCIQRHLGRTKFGEITNSDEWKCLLCDPKPIYDKRAHYHSVYMRFKSGNYKKPAEPRKSIGDAVQRRKSDVAAAAVPAEKIEQLMKHPKNFVEENVAEAFKTLNVYQKCLERERNRWLKNTKGMNADSAASVCRELRKIYAITKQNMDLLDKAVVQSFVEQFPKESTRLHMGKIGVKVKDGALTGKPAKIKGNTKVKLKSPAKRVVVPKRKPAPKKKVGSGLSKKGGMAKEVIRPSLSRTKKIGPASKTRTSRAARKSSDDESDIVTLSSDEEESAPVSRKRTRSSTSSSSPSKKKKRIGPKSKTVS